MHMRVMGYVPESTKRMGCLSIARRFPVELVLTETRQTGGGAAGSGRSDSTTPLEQAHTLTALRSGPAVGC